MDPFFRTMRQRTGIILAALIVLAGASLVIAGISGSVALAPGELPGALQELVHGKSGTLAATLLD